MSPENDWIEQGRRLLETFRSNVADSAPAEGEHPSDCRWCPVCQAAAVVRGERPEVTAALADVLTATAAALRNFAEAAEGDAHVAPDEPEAEAAEPPPVQEIEIA